MPLPRSSIVVPSLCLLMSACPEDPIDGDGDGDGDVLGDAESDDTDDTDDTDTTDDVGDESDVTDETTSGEASCPPAGPYGTEVGDTIDNLILYRQNGDTVPLHGACGQPQRAFVLFGTASW